MQGSEKKYLYLEPIKGAISLRYLSIKVLGKSPSVVSRNEMLYSEYTRQNLEVLAKFLRKLAKNADKIAAKMEKDAAKMS